MKEKSNESQMDLINRSDAINAIRAMQKYKLFAGDDLILVDQAGAMTELMMLPPAQPEITEDDVKEYCRKRCLIVVTSDFYDEMTRRWASAQPDIIRCENCIHSEHWYGNKSRCFLWDESGIGVFNDGFCSYAERKEGETE